MYIYTGHTYGCITRTGTACSELEGETPFFELPTVALGDNDKEVGLEIKDGMITIEKIDHLMEDKHPNGINNGYQRTGTMDKIPTVGESFMVARIGGYLRTSPVTEIVEETQDGGVFKTKNSMYKWSFIKDGTV